MTPFFQVKNLLVEKSGFKLHHISFSMLKGEYVIILGPTGCGKTMLLETLAGLHKPSKGEIILDKQVITTLPPESRHFGFSYQDSLLYPFLNVEDNILFGAKARHKHKEDKTLKRLIELVHIMDIKHLLNRYPHALSGGELQRVSLARAILINPSILLLDEPLSALDPQTRQSMRCLLQEIHQTEGLSIIHVTHDFNEALQLGTKVIVMNHGTIQQQGRTLDVFKQPNSLFVAQFLQRENVIKGKLFYKGNDLWFKDLKDSWKLGPLSKDIFYQDEALYIMIHPGQLQIGKDHPNSWKTIVKKVVLNSTHVELYCKETISWHVSLSWNEFERQSIQEGSTIFLSVNPQSVHFIKTE